MPRVPPSLVVFALVAAAGCAGAGGGASTSPSPTESDPYALPEGILNVLQGTVVGPDQIPIVNASVEILSLSLNQTTDELGQFRFENLEPRDYLISVTMDGYRTKTQRAIIEDGKIFELNFQLDEKPNVTPYHVTTPFRGLLSCEFAYAQNPENVQNVDCGSNDPNNKCCKDFQLDANPAQVVAELFWQEKSQAAHYLKLQLDSVNFGHQDITFGSQVGVSGMQIPIGQQLLAKYYPQGGVVRASVGAAPGVTGQDEVFDFGVAVQQDFELDFTVFYVEPGPYGWSYKSEAGE